MVFKPGPDPRRMVGRPIGAINKRSAKFFETIEGEGFDCALEMINIFREAKKIYDNYGVIYDALEDARITAGKNIVPTEDKADKYLKIALDAAKEIASYSYPKLKAVEHTRVPALEGLTPEQKLEALKTATLYLEAEIKKNGSG